MVPRTLQALIALELIDESLMPTETLENLRRVPEPEFKSQLGAWIKNVYADVLMFVDPSDTESDVRDAFRAYNPVGQQSRMIALFLGLCRAADLRSDDQSAPKSRVRTRQSRPAAGLAKKEKQSAPPVQHRQSGLPRAVAGLIESLPASGKWTQADRDKFITTFTAVLDFSYDVVEVTEREANDD
jgi:hypothetical protein